MWEIGINHQANTFVIFVILGFVSAFLYDIFKIIRYIKKQKFITVLILDISYFVILSVVFFCFFLLRTNGEIRAFAMVGAGLGFLLFKLTLSKVISLLNKPILKFCEFLKKFLKKLLKPLATMRKIVYNRHIKIKRKLKHCQPKKARE